MDRCRIRCGLDEYRFYIHPLKRYTGDALKLRSKRNVEGTAEGVVSRNIQKRRNVRGSSENTADNDTEAEYNRDVANGTEDWHG